MITASCPQCPAKLKVKAELAGKKVRCPRCKASVSIPDDATQASGPLLTDVGSTHSPAKERLTLLATLDVESEIARGGMGAIMRAIDHDIHREVAVKFLLNKADDRQKARFFEEAQITGQLEHPNIVPIHQLGVHDDGRCCFSMKMVKGRSLAEILKDEKAPFTLGRLLNILVSICNALAYAHSRHVIHRDLKPANIMIGDFGEVYVMDWGLAKVLTRTDVVAGEAASSTQTQQKIPSAATTQIAAAGDSPAGSSSAERVTTHRQIEGELTQAGAVMGTPAYMPPEQAIGDHERVDERSDIYSLGAILYEMMTRTPPVGKGGDVVTILMRVAEGAIEPPAIRAPDRAKAGWVPPDLAAIAMKALAKNPGHRYQSVEGLKRDIELYLDGRSVSAKRDTLRERTVKLVKRNKGVSIATAAASVVLLIVGVWSLIAVLLANARTQAEEAEKIAQAKRSVPSLVRASKLTIIESEFDDALVQLDVVLNIDPKEAEARLLKGQVLLARQEFPAARAELEKYLDLKPERVEVKRVLDLIDKSRPDAIESLISMAEELNRQKAFAVAVHLLRRAEKLMAPRQELLEQYRRRLEASKPGFGGRLTLNEKGEFVLNLDNQQELTDLTLLAGMPINVLNAMFCPNLRDLSALKGLPLTRVNLRDCRKVVDLTPLQGLPLIELNVMLTGVISLDPLRGTPLTQLVVAHTGVSDLEPLRGMPLQSLDCRSTKVTNLAPLKGLKLTELLCSGNQITDLAALKEMPLKTLGISGLPISDLSPLQGMKLTSLDMQGCALKDWRPIQGMPLVEFYAANSTGVDLSVLAGMPLKRLTITGDASITDCSPLKGMPLENLMLSRCRSMTDLAPLKDMPLTQLNLHGSTALTDINAIQGAPIEILDLNDCPKLRDLTPLKGMPLRFLTFKDCIELSDVKPLQGAPLISLYFSGCKNLHDVTPLAGMKLEHLGLPPDVTSGMEEIRKIRTLIVIDDMSPEQFWKNWDAKTKGK